MEERKDTVPLCWEIWFADIPKRDDHDHAQAGERPVLIASNNKGNKHSPQVSIFPFTSKLDKRKLPTHVIVHPDDGNGLSKTSTLMCEAPDSIPKRYLKNRMGRIDDPELQYRIKNSIMIQYGVLQEIG